MFVSNSLYMGYPMILSNKKYQINESLSAKGLTFLPIQIDTSQYKILKEGKETLKNDKVLEDIKSS